MRIIPLSAKVWIVYLPPGALYCERDSSSFALESPPSSPEPHPIMALNHASSPVASIPSEDHHPTLVVPNPSEDRPSTPHPLATMSYDTKTPLLATQSQDSQATPPLRELNEEEFRYIDLVRMEKTPPGAKRAYPVLPILKPIPKSGAQRQPPQHPKKRGHWFRGLEQSTPMQIWAYVSLGCSRCLGQR
jgi:hypothetical protein